MTRGVFNCGSGVSRSIFSFAELVQQRCRQVLGVAPEISKTEEVKSLAGKPLVFQSARLAKLGPLMTSGLTTEIDQLLAFCGREFNSKSGK